MTEINRTISTEEVAISLRGGCHVRIKNRGDDTIYVSKCANISVEADGVIEIGPGEVDIVEDVCTNQIIENAFDWYGTIYILSEGTSKVALRTQNHLNFRQTAKGGDGEKTHVGVDMLEVSIEDNDMDMECTADIKKYPDVVLEVAISEIEGFKLSEKAKFTLNRNIKATGDYVYKKYGFVYSKNLSPDITTEELEELLVVENIDGTIIKGAYSMSDTNPSFIHANLTNDGTYKTSYFRGYYVIDVDGTEEYFYTDIYANYGEN